uniref:Uncharacterized protein n=1 Tax=Cucumis melo TaxID=3656 RepID=A0A9I9CRN6_CUCME
MERSCRTLTAPRFQGVSSLQIQLIEEDEEEEEEEEEMRGNRVGKEMERME